MLTFVHAIKLVQIKLQTQEQRWPSVNHVSNVEHILTATLGHFKASVDTQIYIFIYAKDK